MVLVLFMRLQELLLGLRLKFESVFLSVPVLVSFMRPRCNTSRTWSRWQNQSPKSLCLVYNPHMAFSLGLVYKYWFCQSVEVHRNYCQGGTKLSGGGGTQKFCDGGTDHDGVVPRYWTISTIRRDISWPRGEGWIWIWICTSVRLN